MACTSHTDVGWLRISVFQSTPEKHTGQDLLHHKTHNRAIDQCAHPRFLTCVVYTDKCIPLTSTMMRTDAPDDYTRPMLQATHNRAPGEWTATTIFGFMLTKLFNLNVYQ